MLGRARIRRNKAVRRSIRPPYSALFVAARSATHQTAVPADALSETECRAGQIEAETLEVQRAGDATPSRNRARITATLRPAQKALLARTYRGIAPELAPARKELADLQRRKAAIEKTMPMTLVSMAGPPRVVRVQDLTPELAQRARETRHRASTGCTIRRWRGGGSK